MKKINISRISEDFISNHPYIKSCLKNGLINYSSLARMIAEKHSLSLKDNFDALLVACRRYREKIKKSRNEKDILDLLKGSSISVRNRVMSVVLEKNAPSSNIELFEKKVRKNRETFRLIEGVTAVTLITHEDYQKEIKNIFGNAIINETKGLVEVTLKTSKDIENIPGVLSFLYSLLAESEVNIIETMSCWTDTIFILEEKDLQKVMQLFKF